MTEEWQSEHETIVLVPQYEDSNTEDPAYTMELVTEIVNRYSIDTSKEYLVEQSSGTIRSIRMFIPKRYPCTWIPSQQGDTYARSGYKYHLHS